MAHQRRAASNDGFMSMGSIIGDSVRTSHGEKIGQLEEFIFDAISGHVGFAILSFTGNLGLGDRLFVIPWQRLQVDTGNRCLIIDMEKDALAFAPGFGRDNWPDIGDPVWANEILNFYQDDHREFAEQLGSSKASA